MVSASLGCLSVTPEAPQSWRRARERLSSRNGSSERVFARSGVNIAYRASDTEGVFEDESYFVLLEGFVNNAETLAKQLELSPAGSPTSPAQQIAQLFKRQGATALFQLTGQFSLVVVDTSGPQVRAYLMRDRFGNKPLMYARMNNGWCWGSEVKCLLPLLDRRELNPEALSEVFHYRWLLGARTLAKGVQQVLPSHAVELQIGTEPAIRRYFRLKFDPASEDADLERWRDRTERAIDDCLADASRRYDRMGILLSGGVDSSLLAAKAIQHFKQCVAIIGRWRTYANPEFENATRVAKHLGLEQIVVDVDDDYIAGYFPTLIWRAEEPPRHYNAFALSQLLKRAGQEVAAVLHGEAADALFGPAEQRMLIQYSQKQNVFGLLPTSLRQLAGRMLPAGPGGGLHKLRKHLLEDPSTFLLRLDAIEHRVSPQRIVSSVPQDPWPGADVLSAFYSPNAGMVERFQEIHLHTMCRSALEVVDKFGTPAGVEVITPFLSPWVVGVGARVPSGLKISNGYSKPVVRELACKYFPKDWIYAHKFGFPTPTLEWLAGPLRPWVDFLQDKRTWDRGLFRCDRLAQLNIKEDYELIWTAACLELFIREFLDEDPALQP